MFSPASKIMIISYIFHNFYRLTKKVFYENQKNIKIMLKYQKRPITPKNWFKHKYLKCESLLFHFLTTQTSACLQEHVGLINSSSWDRSFSSSPRTWLNFFTKSCAFPGSGRFSVWLNTIHHKVSLPLEYANIHRNTISRNAIIRAYRTH